MSYGNIFPSMYILLHVSVDGSGDPGIPRTTVPMVLLPLLAAKVTKA